MLIKTPPLLRTEESGFADEFKDVMIWIRVIIISFVRLIRKINIFKKILLHKPYCFCTSIPKYFRRSNFCRHFITPLVYVYNPSYSDHISRIKIARIKNNHITSDLCGVNLVLSVVGLVLK